MPITIFPVYNVIRWPNSDGSWWLVSEASETSGYSPIIELNPRWSKGRLEPTWQNQLYAAAELLVKEGLNALNNPHAAIGRECKCGQCFCCAAEKIVGTVR